MAAAQAKAAAPLFLPVVLLFWPDQDQEQEQEQEPGQEREQEQEQERRCYNGIV